jgi:NAD-dependent histone deacetylase SIR2
MLDCIKRGEVAVCERCKGYAKPDITFFGEDLPAAFTSAVGRLQEADLLLIMGTSLVVFPFAALTGIVSENAPRVLINREPSGDL